MALILVFVFVGFWCVYKTKDEGKEGEEGAIKRGGDREICSKGQGEEEAEWKEQSKGGVRTKERKKEETENEIVKERERERGGKWKRSTTHEGHRPRQERVLLLVLRIRSREIDLGHLRDTEGTWSLGSSSWGR